jgi:outer membrane protein assembly factor BamB
MAVRRAIVRLGAAAMACWLGLASGPAAQAADWLQWGGPTRDFRLPDAKVLAWAESGPKTLWKRALGEGYSAIVAADETLYTMYREGEEEVIAALSAETGETRWAHRYAAPLPADATLDFGKGPNATPLIAGDKLVAIGFMGAVHCLNRADGSVAWKVDIVKDLGGTFCKFGYSSSPLLYKDAVILPTGGSGHSVVAVNLSDGKLKWSSADFENSYSSPVLFTVGGRKQIAIVMTKEVIGLDAETGQLAWAHAFTNQWDTHCGTPVDCGEGILLAPSFGESLALQVTPDGDGFKVERLWSSKKIGAGQTNVVRMGEHLFGAAGSGRASFYSAVRLKDGEDAWRERVPPAQTLLVGGNLLLLDEAGALRLAGASPEKFEQVSQAQVLEAKAWTVPTLVGSRLYLRDQKSIVALDLAGS